MRDALILIMFLTVYGRPSTGTQKPLAGCRQLHPLACSFSRFVLTRLTASVYIHKK